MSWTVAGNIRGPQGAQGPQGPAGPSGVSGVTARGAWSNANSYAVNDLATWGGSSYVATATHASGANQPPTGTTADPGTDDTAVNAGWATFAVQGAQGAQGIQGIQGTAGTAGAQGSPGARGASWFTGHGAPGTIAGSAAGDHYLDLDTGDVYDLS